MLIIILLFLLLLFSLVLNSFGTVVDSALRVFRPKRIVMNHGCTCMPVQDSDNHACRSRLSRYRRRNATRRSGGAWDRQRVICNSHDLMLFRYSWLFVFNVISLLFIVINIIVLNCREIKLCFWQESRGHFSESRASTLTRPAPAIICNSRFFWWSSFIYFRRRGSNRVAAKPKHVHLRYPSLGRSLQGVTGICHSIMQK